MTIDRPDVIICDCTARDGLQNEEAVVPTALKIQMVEKVASLGFSRVEIASFSSPKRVPQFADAEEVVRGAARRPGTSYKAVCVNDVAVQRAIRARQDGATIDEISVVVSASETHNLVGTRKTRSESLAGFQAAIAEALDAGLQVGGTIGTAFGCPFEGPMPETTVMDLAGWFAARGVGIISLGDTTGMANPRQVKGLFKKLRSEFPDVMLAAHFHDSRGAALANCWAAIEEGVDCLDSAFGGLGGHPAKIRYGAGHTGNAATEDLVAMLEAAGVRTGVDVGRLVETGQFVEKVIGRELQSRVVRAGLITDLLQNPL